MHSGRVIGLLVPALLLAAPGVAGAQRESYSPGQMVEAKSFAYNPPWQKGKIVAMAAARCLYPERPIHVQFLDGRDACVGADEVRSLPGAAPQQGAAAAQGGPASGAPAAGAFRVGSRVDVVHGDSGGRATIVQADGNRFKVRPDGCDPRYDAWEEIDALRPAATISAAAPEIRFLIGNWSMFTPSYPNTAVRGTDVYRQYGAGAKAPPLQIRADGTYTWYFDYGKPPVTGRWTPHARIEGMRFGTEVLDGVIIKAPNGAEWKVYRRISTLDKGDHVTARTMCSGQTVMGTRL